MPSLEKILKFCAVTAVSALTFVAIYSASQIYQKINKSKILNMYVAGICALAPYLVVYDSLNKKKED